VRWTEYELFSGAHYHLLAAKDCVQLAFLNDKGLLEVVPVRRWSSAGWYQHVDQTETTIRIVPR
jgi:hypothetical protein